MPTAASKRIVALESAADIFGLLSCDTARAILTSLADGERYVCQIADAVGMRQQATTYHLKVAGFRGLIESQRRGKRVYYSLTDLGRRSLGVAEAVGAIA